MKRPDLTLSLAFGLLVLGAAPAAQATNTNVEIALRSYPDLSMFYQALINTGVMNELDQNQHYTIFAPVNTAFVEVPQETYPCFYSVQCRPQIAEFLRDHILAGRHDLADLVSYGQGLQTVGVRYVHVDEPYLGSYDVDNRAILSESEVGGNMVYRIDGVLASRRELAQFQQANVMPASSVTVTKTYRTVPLTPPAPGASRAAPDDVYGDADGDVTETTIIRTDQY